LRRQQANAVVAARALIVEGAAGMVELALNRLAANEVVELDEERKASMVSNLLVVLCGDQPPSPVVGLDRSTRDRSSSGTSQDRSRGP
jgi:hypothetical protein